MKNIIKKFREKGFKLTPQRLAILKYLDNNTMHPSAEDVFIEIKKEYPTVSFATVYNTLEALLNLGEIMEVTIDPERKHFDPNPTPHHHVVCTVCGKIGDVFADYSKELKLPEETLDEFNVSGNHVNFYGVCRKCRTKEFKQ